MIAVRPGTGKRWLAAHRRWLAVHRRSVIAGALALWAAALVTFLVLVVAYDLDVFGPLGGPFVLGFGAFAITGSALGPLATQPMEVRTVLVALSVSATTMVFPLLPLAIVLFPDGRLPSRRWRLGWRCRPGSPRAARR